MKKENGRARGKVSNTRQMCESFFVPDQVVTQISWSPEQDQIGRQELDRDNFYQKYRDLATEYDKGFLKKYDADLNMTLIFVRGMYMRLSHTRTN